MDFLDAILFILSLFCLLLSLLFELIHTWIVSPLIQEASRNWEELNKHTKSFYKATPDDLKMFYETNKPMILRRVPILDFLVEEGFKLFYFFFGLLFVISSYLMGSSLLNIALLILSIGGLWFFFHLFVVFIGRTTAKLLFYRRNNL